MGPRQTPLFQVAFCGLWWDGEFLGSGNGGLLVEVGRQGDEVLLFEVVLATLGDFGGIGRQNLIDFGFSGLEIAVGTNQRC